MFYSEASPVCEKLVSSLDFRKKNSVCIALTLVIE
jgi:hypothetical protein